jgi:hypothetical protein
MVSTSVGQLSALGRSEPPVTVSENGTGTGPDFLNWNQIFTFSRTRPGIGFRFYLCIELEPESCLCYYYYYTYNMIRTRVNE